MEKINIVEILKNCPQGTKLYSPAYGELEFDCIKLHDMINPPQHVIYCYDTIKVYNDRELQLRVFNRDGSLIESVAGECVLFPSKDQRDWSKFERPIVVDLKFPERVYWFQATGDAKFDNLLMKSLQKITGITDHCGMSPSAIVFSSYDIIDCASKNNNLARAAMMFGTELRIKE